MDLGDKIKAARAQKGLTQKELAQRAKLTERTIQRIENHVTLKEEISQYASLLLKINKHRTW